MKLLPETFDKTKQKDVKRLQDILIYLGGTLDENTDDIKTRTLGTRTTDAIKEVKKIIALPQTASLNETTITALNQKTIEKHFSSKTQTANLHRNLIKAARIAKLELDLSEDMKVRQQGRQTGNALLEFQKKYNLQETGILNKETLERLESVAASRVKPFIKLKVPRTERLMKVRYPVRLNMQKSKVADLQRALAWIGHDINKKEADLQTYGRTTRKAVIAF
ncbi:MAG: peptidoglycan-binding protein, partial [Proteobacteria bacterium]|nr:peptidoglycan-binding protein [Pseudomonadota bacterium]